MKGLPVPALCFAHVSGVPVGFSDSNEALHVLRIYADRVPKLLESFGGLASFQKKQTVVVAGEPVFRRLFNRAAKLGVCPFGLKRLSVSDRQEISSADVLRVVFQ